MINLKALAFDKGLKQKDIAEILGIDQPAASRVINGRLNLTQKHFEKLVQVFGEETLKSYDVSPEDFFRAVNAQVTIIPHTVVEEVREELREEMKNPKREDVETVETEEVEIKETIIIRSDVLNQEGVDLKKDLKKGILDVEVKPTQDVLPPHQAKVYIGTDEMSPKIEANEPVFVRFLNSTQDFEDGYMYLVDLYHGSFVRWVVREDEEHVRLLSMKSEKVIPLSSVKSFAEVVAITKHPETLPKERITMQEYIVHKDEQLDSLLAQNDKLIDLHGRMMDIIEGQLKK